MSGPQAHGASGAATGPRRGDPAPSGAPADVGELLTALASNRADLVRLLDRDAVLRAALGHLVTGRSSVAWTAEPTSDAVLHLSAVDGDRTGALRGLSVPVGLGLTGKVHQSLTAHWVDDYFAAPHITHHFDRPVADEGISRLLAVPLVVDGRPAGVLAHGLREPGRFGDREVDRARELAHEAALALSVAHRARLAREIAVEDERRRLATALHDSVGALLFAIGSGVAGLSADVASTDPDLSARLVRLTDLAADATTALRESLRTLHSSPAALALGVALRSDCRAFTDRSGVRSELVVLDAELPELPPSRARVLAGAVREALLNVEKHARAEAVVVTVSCRDDVLTVAVTDDGVGADPAAPWGVGLTTSAEALAQLGGRLTLVSDAPGGTTWRVRLPC